MIHSGLVPLVIVGMLPSLPVPPLQLLATPLIQLTKRTMEIKRVSPERWACKWLTRGWVKFICNIFKGNTKEPWKIKPIFMILFFFWPDFEIQNQQDRNVVCAITNAFKIAVHSLLISLSHCLLCTCSYSAGVIWGGWNGTKWRLMHLIYNNYSHCD